MRPSKINLPFKSLDKILLGISLASVLGMLLLPILNYSQLPAEIPMHFDVCGNADRFGDKIEIWALSVIGIALVALLWWISTKPHTFNYAVKITPENAVRQYGSSVKLMRVLAAIIGLGITFIIWGIIRNVLGEQNGLNPLFLPLLKEK